MNTKTWMTAIASAALAASAFAFDDEPDELNWDSLGGIFHRSLSTVRILRADVVNAKGNLPCNQASQPPPTSGGNFGIISVLSPKRMSV